MYSDNHFQDLAFDEPGSANAGYSATFDINDFGLSTELFSDPSYRISSSASSHQNPLLQTIQRNTASSSSSRFPSYADNNNHNDSNAYHHDYSIAHLGAGDTGGINDKGHPSSSITGIGNALLGSPQPSTIKKLKSHLSGIGGVGGYLTSPMGSFRHDNGNDSPNVSPAYSVLKPKASSSGSNLNHHQQSLGSSPLKSIHSSSQQQQDPQCLELHTPLPPLPQSTQSSNGTTSQYTSDFNNAFSAPQMQRLATAPASFQNAFASTSTRSSSSGRSSKNSKKNINPASDNSMKALPQSATVSTFSEMDSGGMSTYGRPIQRSTSEDPSSQNQSSGYDSHNCLNNTIAGRKHPTNASFLPYPDQLPTSATGRGIKNARDANQGNSSIQSTSTSSLQMEKSESEPIPTPSTISTTSTHSPRKGGFTNLNKPFIQYFPPNSPAAKSANARNKKSLSVKTSEDPVAKSLDGSAPSTSGNNNSSNSNNGKMVPVRMARQAHEMPLTPPVSANMVSNSASMTSPQQQQDQQMRRTQQQYPSQMQSLQNNNNPQQQQHQTQQYSNQQMSPYHQQQQDTRQYFSPRTNTVDYKLDAQSHLGIIEGTGGQSNLPSTMPSFEFSLEQFGGQSVSGDDNNQDLLNQFSNNGNSTGYNNNSAIDFSSVLGLPSPHQSHHHQQDPHFSNGSSSARHGLLSPTMTQPPLSAASTHSSVFSDDQALLFGMTPTSPYFASSSSSSSKVMVPPIDDSQSQSIDQALASLLGTPIPNRDGSSTPQPQLNLQTFSPSSHQQQQHFSPNLQQQHQQQRQQQQLQGQFGLGVSSPPFSPPHSAMTSPAPSTSWAPYQQQSNMQNLVPNIDPALQSLDNQQNFAMLSPQSAHYGGENNHYSQVNNNYSGHIQGANGRLLSSPRRLRGMQSAPDLNAMYSDASNGFNEAFGITSSSPRKPSLKRGRGDGRYGGGDSDEENQQTQQFQRYGYTQYGDGSSERDDDEDDADEHQSGNGYDRPPPRKRANSIHSSTGAKIDPTLNGNNAVAAVLLPLVNPNPARLRPGPKPKTSLPNLQAAHQGVFQVSPRAPPVPAFPAQYLSSAASPNPSNAESCTGTATPGTTAISAGCLSPDPDTGYLKPPPQGGVSKDMLATFYQIGTGSKQTKKGKPQRMYICSIPGCEKEFPRKSAVESHIQTHLEDKPFACPYDSCGASFVRSHDLTRHVRIHSGSKPFQCVCGKGFARGDALTRHRQRGICEGSLVPRRW